MKNTIEKKISEAIAQLTEEALRILPSLTTYLASNKEDCFETGLQAIQNTAILISLLENNIEQYNSVNCTTPFEDSLVAATVKEALKLLTRGADKLAEIATIMKRKFPEEPIHYGIDILVSHLDDFYDEHLEKWEALAEKWEN
jgi:hypothetical protein